VDRPSELRPVYQELEGWSERLEGAKVLDDLPRAARAYIRFLEEGAGVPIYLVSVGPQRKQTIVLHNPFVGRAAAP
jgi:adenylosuccinate synthase